MKKTKILLILPFIAGLVSCGNQEVNAKDYLLASLLNGVNVKITGTQTITYPKDYAYLNTSSSFSIDRDYKNIVESDGSLTPAVRENTGMDFSTYFKGKDGVAVSEYYTPKNEIKSDALVIGGNKILFNERFANPFEYVDTSDIGDDFSLSDTKATMVIEAYTGLQFSVSEAKFVVENNVATSLDVKLYDRIDLVAESETSNMAVTSSLEVDIKFTYGINEISHLQPRPEADKALRDAFANLTSYTMTVSCEATSIATEIFVTDKDIFIHNGAGTTGLVDGDKYYKNMGGNYYDEYTYSATTGKFSLTDFDLNKNQFLPDFESFSPNILVKNSEGVYEFDTAAAKYGLEELIIPDYGVSGGIGITGTLTLKNNNLDTFTARVYPNQPFNITEKFSNQGNTSMPNWLDVSLIK